MNRITIDITPTGAFSINTGNSAEESSPTYLGLVRDLTQKIEDLQRQLIEAGQRDSGPKYLIDWMTLDVVRLLNSQIEDLRQQLIEARRSECDIIDGKDIDFVQLLNDQDELRKQLRAAKAVNKRLKEDLDEERKLRYAIVEFDRTFLLTRPKILSTERYFCGHEVFLGAKETSAYQPGFAVKKYRKMVDDFLSRESGPQSKDFSSDA